MWSVVSKSHWGQLPLPALNRSKLDCRIAEVKISGRTTVVSMGMLAPRKFLQKRKKMEVFKDAADEAEKKNWRRLMKQIDETGSAVAVLRSERTKSQTIPRDLVVGTLIRYKQLKRWNHVCEILEWLQTQTWWDFGEMDFLMLITAYGKLGDFNGAERILCLMNKKGFVPNVISQTALMEAYGRGGRYNNAEAIFRRMQHSGPEPSALSYQITLKTFVEGSKYREAEELFYSLLNNGKPPLKPDQKMFHMMIYMYKKAGNYEKARRTFALMAERRIERCTITYNSLMSFETNFKEVSKIYDQMQRAGLQPDVVSYALLINAYGKARREDEALAVFEEMLDAGVRYSPDLCSYTTMLSAYVNALDMEGAEKFFRRLIHDGFKPNVVTYGTLIKGYAKLNDLGKIMEKYEEMHGCGIEANQTILTTIMDAYGRNGDFSGAVVWFKEMESNGIHPDQKAKNILLSLAKTDKERQEANELVGHSDEVSGLNAVNGSVPVVDSNNEGEGDHENDEEEEEGNYEYFDGQLAMACDEQSR
ncbi:pentatricopeptide repeat-containing protein At3g59040 isoform X2 [Prosopis cineraria]|uniref:pentatricopeptide repeat-containing protein At3g59040 isoform X2 n=1 Tax=Prosopis cineraria TaxID=364024 RepID=UPI00240FFF67|nr:pentatricopeptide repeat-containing protein At3g59040 isoform X2 [Prosopis cineraria]